MHLEGDAVAYLLGRDGSTKRRLERCSECQIEVSHDTVELFGAEPRRKLCRLLIEITLQQRKGGKMNTDFEDLGARDDCEEMEVPTQAIGFVLGKRGATLRLWEERYGAYMVFDNDQVRDGKKRIYVLGRPDARRKALEAVAEAVSFRMRKDAQGGGGGGGGGYRSRGPPPSRRRSRSRSYDRRDRGRDRGRDDYDRRPRYRSRSRSRERHY